MFEVQPVAILSAVFCMIWRDWRLVFDIRGDQVVLPYSKMGLVIALYVARIVSLSFPHFGCCECFRDVQCFLSFFFCYFAVFREV